MKTRLIIAILGGMLKLISPLLRDTLDSLIKQLYAKALTTDVEIDDLFVEALADFLDIDLGDVAPKDKYGN